MNQRGFLPTETFPIYKILDADTIGELEDTVSQVLREYETDTTVVQFIGGPELIKEEDDLYWIQPVLIEIRQ